MISLIGMYTQLYLQIPRYLQALYYLVFSTYTDKCMLLATPRILIDSYPVRFPPFLDARHPTSDPGQGPPFLGLSRVSQIGPPLFSEEVVLKYIRGHFRVSRGWAQVTFWSKRRILWLGVTSLRGF